MIIRLREAQEQDWPGILKAADASLPWQEAGNRQWLGNRRNFDVAHLRRRHYVAEETGENRIVGYGSIEEGPESRRFRVFIVTDARLLDTVGNELYRRLREDLDTLQAQIAWVREEARDQALLAFFRALGFGSARQFRTPEGLEVVMLEQRLATAAHRALRLRDAEARDDEALASLARQLHPDKGAVRLHKPRQGSRTIVAEDEARVIGFALVTFIDYGLGGYGMLEELAIEPGFRGRGIGTRLVRECRDWLASEGCDVMFVSARDDEAAAFYRRLGFTSCTGEWLYCPATIRT
jgi:predicted N-acetyltransferase YhbS